MNKRITFVFNKKTTLEDVQAYMENLKGKEVAEDGFKVG